MAVAVISCPSGSNPLLVRISQFVRALVKCCHRHPLVVLIVSPSSLSRTSLAAPQCSSSKASNSCTTLAKATSQAAHASDHNISTQEGRSALTALRTVWALLRLRVSVLTVCYKVSQRSSRVFEPRFCSRCRFSTAVQSSFVRLVASSCS